MSELKSRQQLTNKSNSVSLVKFYYYVLLLKVIKTYVGFVLTFCNYESSFIPARGVGGDNFLFCGVPVNNCNIMLNQTKYLSALRTS